MSLQRIGLFLLALLLGACNSSPAPQAATRETPPAEAKSTSGKWGKIPRAPTASYRPEGAFWIDGHLVVVAGSTVQSFDQVTRKWEVIAEIPQAEECEGCGYLEIAVWTGDELLLWGGGFTYLAPDGDRAAGVAVTLNGDIDPLPDAPIEIPWWHTAVWTGDEMIVWGGGCGRHECKDGAAFDPETGSWREIARSPTVGYGHSVVWTGDEMIVWGGSDDIEAEGRHGYPRSFLATGAAYEPETDSWRMLAESSLDARAWHSATWTGQEMIVWGGLGVDDAGAYNPSTDSWREISVGPLSGRVDHSAVWSGSEMLVFGGGSAGGGISFNDGAAYDPETDSWAVLPAAPVAGRSRHQALWTDKGMLVWGGQRRDGRELSDGAAFRPAVKTGS